MARPAHASHEDVEAEEEQDQENLSPAPAAAQGAPAVKKQGEPRSEPRSHCFASVLLTVVPPLAAAARKRPAATAPANPAAAPLKPAAKGADKAAKPKGPKPAKSAYQVGGERSRDEGPSPGWPC